MKKKIYRIVCNKNGRFEGVQRFGDDVITGGNVFSQICFSYFSEEKRNDILKIIKKRYPKYEFKMCRILKKGIK